MNTDTPLTDKNCWREGTTATSECVLASFARNLERENNELRRFKAAALTLTTEASVNYVMSGEIKNGILVHHAGQPITSADVREAMSKEKT